jgi:hypothetical protein
MFPVTCTNAKCLQHYKFKHPQLNLTLDLKVCINIVTRQLKARRNSQPRKDIHCWATAGKHVSTATKTRSRVKNTWAITRQQPS